MTVLGQTRQFPTKETYVRFLRKRTLAIGLTKSRVPPEMVK